MRRGRCKGNAHWLVPLLSTVSPALVADTIDTRYQEPWEQCGYCHEYDGNSMMPGFPKLAGQPVGYLVKQLRDFRAGRRTGTMQATAELLDDSDIAAVAEYFSVQTPMPGASAQRGTASAEVLFREGSAERGLPACAGCHGPEAEGRNSVPRLAGQHAAYLELQLKGFATGERQNDPGAVMQRIAGMLRGHETRLLATWLAAQPVSGK